MNEKEKKSINNKEKIINVALEEFVLNGYKAASTNSICKNAQVSKGLLYHYYKSKEVLYLNVLQHVIDKFKENITIDKEGAGAVASAIAPNTKAIESGMSAKTKKAIVTIINAIIPSNIHIVTICFPDFLSSFNINSLPINIPTSISPILHSI